MTPLRRSNIANLAGFAFLALASNVQAHGGGLNSEGCHNNRKTGDYHCHRGPSSGTPQARGLMSADQMIQRAQPAAPAENRGAINASRVYEPGKCYVGPRGGTYTITPSGRKNYSGC
ncbi:MAG: YHYH domain-containing protein [Burkholderiaceae bacterium]|nr:YHYH domain-containing protein [Burkholderiaceae bacterium]